MTLDTEQGRKGPFANTLADAVWRHRTTIAAVARAVGIPRPDLSQMVNGHRLPSAAQLDALCAFFKTSHHDLYPRKEFRDAIEATRSGATS